jgi:hypothetical protein
MSVGGNEREQRGERQTDGGKKRWSEREKQARREHRTGPGASGRPWPLARGWQANAVAREQLAIRARKYSSDAPVVPACSTSDKMHRFAPFDLADPSLQKELKLQQTALLPNPEKGGGSDDPIGSTGYLQPASLGRHTRYRLLRTSPAAGTRAERGKSRGGSATNKDRKVPSPANLGEKIPPPTVSRSCSATKTPHRSGG